MDDFVVLDSENCGVGDKPKGGKMVRGSTVGTMARKGLADISNLPQRPKTSSQGETPQPILLSTEECIDKLHKENMALVKLLADRNKIIELSGIELQKLRINLRKARQQNLQLAQANTQILAELNSGKDRLKALHHELGCKNGLLKARNLELEEKVKTVTCQETENEVGTIKCNQEGESSQADKGDNKPCNTNRRRQLKIQSLGPSVKQVEAKETPENKRPRLRRQSARFKFEDPEPTEDLFKIDDVQADEGDNKPCNTNRRRQLKSQSLGPSVKQVEAKEKAENKRPSLRRQSARFKSEDPEPPEDLFEIDDTTFSVCPHEDSMHENDPTLFGSSVNKKDEVGNSDPSFEAEAFQRSSIGRPLRRAAERVQSYKEIPLNTKMRRS